MNAKILIPLFFLIVPIVVIVQVYYNCRIDHLSGYEFIIDELSENHTKSLKLRHGKKWISFQSFVISNRADIQIGDIVVKDKCSSSLFIYRIDAKDSKKLVHEVTDSGLFTSNWFCK